MTPAKLTKLLAHAFGHNLKVLVKGAPGIGKSDIITQAAARAKADLIIMHPVVSDPTDFKGMPAVVKPSSEDEKQWGSHPLAEFLPFGDLRKLVRAKSRTVCFMDDIGQAPGAVQAALMQLLQAREVNGHQISKHVVFCGATNDATHMSGVSNILEAVKSRFDTIVELVADVESWKTWALQHDMPPELIGFIDLRPDLLSDFKPTRELTNSPCPRTVHSVGKWVKSGYVDIDVLSGAVGEGFAAEFLGFMRIYKSMPDLDTIKNSPSVAPLPQDPSTHFAICAALTYHADSIVFPAYHTYILRLPSEWQTRAMRDIIIKHPDLKDTATFVKWAAANVQNLA